MTLFSIGLGVGLLLGFYIGKRKFRHAINSAFIWTIEALEDFLGD